MTSSKPKKSLLARILKWTGISLLLIILLLIAAPFIFKDKIVALVKEQANANLNAKVDFGDFDLSLISSFPDFRFKIQKVSVIGIDDFKDDTLAYIGELSTDINLKSVLNGGPYQINSIVIDKARILGKVLKSGVANWDIAKPSTDTISEVAADTSAPTKFALKLKEFKITEAYIVYDDQKGNMYAKLENFNYSINGDFTQDIFVMKNLMDIAKTTFKMDGVAYLNEVHTKMKADLDMDMLQSKYTFKENEFSLNDLTLGFDGYVLMPDTNIDMDLKFGAKQTEFKAILSLIPSVYSKDFASVKTSGKIALDGHAKGRYNASQLPAFGVNLSIVNAMFKYPSLPKSVDKINIDVKVLNPTGVLDATTVDINKFHIEMAGNPIDIVAHIKTPISDPGINTNIKGLINLASVKDFVPLEKGDNLSGTIKADISADGHMSAIDKKEFDKFNASGAFEIDQMNYKTSTLPYEVKLNTMKLNFTTQYVELAAFDALMGKSDIRASGRIDNLLQYIFKDDLIKGTFALNSNLMDLNELMASDSTAATTATVAVDSTATTGVFAVPANYDFNLDAKINKVLYTNLVLENMVGNIVVRDQKVDMTNLRMNVIGGALTINGYYETTNIKKPTVGMNLKMENFDIQTTFKTFNSVKKLAPIGEYAKGMFTASLENFKTSLNDKMEPDLNAVDAHGVFKTNKVSVGGFPPFVKLGEALKIEQLKNMDVDNVNAKYAIKNGRLYLEPFDVKIAGINTNISGSTGLDQTIDYTYKMEIPRSMFGGAANKVLDGLMAQANAKAGTNITLGEKIKVNVSMGGTVTKPTIKTGMKGEEGQPSVISTVTTQALNAGIDKANEEAQKILEDAKVQVDRLKAEAKTLSDKTKQEGYANADRLVEEASNPIAKMAAKKGAELAKKEVDKKAQQILDEADVRGKKILDDAKVKADAKAAESKK
ncbi:AsmA family protein [Aurantibacillus circumpalustris]|uniref:AsmA family protein n=1 Tax=Aurantibacillus circumpalustris TaxID=3036359 RepID=UPI00295B6E97|nr:AsmA-like C-terminal region-containing protein [Aurantibacillus circumpalustris]